MDVLDYLKVFRRRWLTIVLSVLLFAAAAMGVTALSKKTYTAKASSFVTVTQSTDSNPASIYQQSQFTIQRVQSYTQMVTSPLVLEPVISSLSLPLTVRQLAAKLSASSPTSTVILNVSASDRDPQRAAAIANAVSKQLATLVESLEKPNAAKTSAVRITTTGPASPPSTPSFPRPTFNLALGILLGLAVGLIIALLREQLNNSIDSSAEVQAITGSNPLGQVLHNPKREQRLVALQKHDVQSEAFRSIRVNLRFVDVDNPPRTVVVTSGSSQEGKTTVTANLAITLATAGAKVCLVDADLRRPRVGDLLGIENAAGLTDVLAGEHRLSDVLVPWHDGLITVLTAGSVPPDASALLSSKAMASVLETLRGQFDVVLLDSPPLLPVSDAAVLGDLCDGVIVVARRGRTQRHNLVTVVDSLSRANIDLLGTVFNDVRTGRGRATKHAYGYDPVQVEAAGDTHPQRVSAGNEPADAPAVLTAQGSSPAYEVTTRSVVRSRARLGMRAAKLRVGTRAAKEPDGTRPRFQRKGRTRVAGVRPHGPH